MGTLDGEDHEAERETVYETEYETEHDRGLCLRDYLHFLFCHHVARVQTAVDDSRLAFEPKLRSAIFLQQ